MILSVLRIIYWTTWGSAGSVKRADMDGSNASVIATGLSYPCGIAIDFQASRIYWTVAEESRVESGDMQGKNVQRVKQFPSGSWTFGIAVYGNRIYVTNYSLQKLQSFNTAGQDLQEVHTDTNNLLHLAVISTRPDRPNTRANSCEYHGCSKVCVLTRTAFKCFT